MTAVEELSFTVGKKSACQALQVPRASFYKHLESGCQSKTSSSPRSIPPLALEPQEKSAVKDLLHSDRFCDKAPHTVYAELLDEDRYFCSVSTMYRILREEHGCVRERRKQVNRPKYSKPELLATGPNQVWSWDITKLKGPAKWTYFYLYVIIDIYSRYVVGWMVAHREQQALAKRLIDDSCAKQSIEPGRLTIHADRGSSMTSKAVAHLLADLGVTKTHSRPHVSNDNPYSEAQFKTLKYSPRFPDRFGSIQDARAFCQHFFSWYNKEHRHSGIGLMTPEQVHYGLAEAIYDRRSDTLSQAFERHPKRFKGRKPKPPDLPKEAWINKPKTDGVGA